MEIVISVCGMCNFSHYRCGFVRIDLYFRIIKINIKNMKNLTKFFILFLTVVISSCSSSDDSNNNQISQEDSFNLAYENSNVAINEWEAYRVEDRIAVIGSADDGKTFLIEFNVHGDFTEAGIYSVTDYEFPSSVSWPYFKSNYFNFELVGVDEVNNKVAVNFSGNLYEDEYDPSSTTHFVEGSFNVSYTVTTSNFSELEVYAKINGEDWYSTTSDQSGGFFDGSNISLSYYSDDEYSISFVMNHDVTQVGMYLFDPNSAVNKVALHKYDPINNTFIEYTASGIFNITEKNVGMQTTQIIGTYELTATDGSEVIEISEGSVNLVYYNY